MHLWNHKVGLQGKQLSHTLQKLFSCCSCVCQTFCIQPSWSAMHNLTHCPADSSGFPPEQHPIVCQLGGSNPQTLAAAAKVVARYGYDEINLNCGCPSERVAGAGCFGAAMMLQPQLVAQCCQAMQDAVPHIPVTVKCRLGMPCTPIQSCHCQVQIKYACCPIHTCHCQVQSRYALHSHTILSVSGAVQVFLAVKCILGPVRCQVSSPCRPSLVSQAMQDAVAHHLSLLTVC